MGSKGILRQVLNSQDPIAQRDGSGWISGRRKAWEVSSTVQVKKYLLRFVQTQEKAKPETQPPLSFVVLATEVLSRGALIL